MSNGRSDSEGNPEDERRPHRGRDTSVNNPWSPGYNELWSAFIELGININNQESVDAFREALEWAQAGARRRKWWHDMRGRVLVGCLVAAGGGAAVSAISWLTSHTFGSGH